MNLIDEISRIEDQIEELAEISERCRKIILVSKAAIGCGVALPVFMMLCLFVSNQVVAIGSIGAVLGGLVSLGSNGVGLGNAFIGTESFAGQRFEFLEAREFAKVAEAKAHQEFL